jgi:hypothetical protein
MYNSILDPQLTLDNGDYETKIQAWINFNPVKYTELVCERAVIELKKLLSQLPPETKCEYIEGSAYIDSPRYYNYRGDEFRFKIKTENGLFKNNEQAQCYLRSFFLDDWEAEFGAAYGIYEYISSNYGIADFPYDKAVSVT